MSADGVRWVDLLGLAVLLSWRIVISQRGDEPKGGISRTLNFLCAAALTLFLAYYVGLGLGLRRAR